MLKLAENTSNTRGLRAFEKAYFEAKGLLHSACEHATKQRLMDLSANMMEHQSSS